LIHLFSLPIPYTIVQEKKGGLECTKKQWYWLLAIIDLSSAKSSTRLVGSEGWSDINILNRSGAITAPRGTPALIGCGEEMNEPYRTEKNRSSK
jgi:hypothetical protein